MDFPDYKLKFNSAPSKIIVLLLIMTLALIVVIEPFSYFIPMPEFFKEMMADFIQPNIFSFLTLVVAAPILEEILFRGIILEGFLKNYSPTKAIVWSALIFGIAHLNPWQAIGATFAGLFIGWIYWKTGSIVPGILIHFTNNLIVFVTTFSTSTETDSFIQLIDNKEIYFMLYAVSLIVFSIGYKLMNQNFKSTIKS